MTTLASQKLRLVFLCHNRPLMQIWRTSRSARSSWAKARLVRSFVLIASLSDSRSIQFPSVVFPPWRYEVIERNIDWENKTYTAEEMPYVLLTAAWKPLISKWPDITKIPIWKMGNFNFQWTFKNLVPGWFQASCILFYTFRGLQM